MSGHQPPALPASSPDVVRPGSSPSSPSSSPSRCSRWCPRASATRDATDTPAGGRRQHARGRARRPAARGRGPGRDRALDRRLGRARPGRAGRDHAAGGRAAEGSGAGGAAGGGPRVRRWQAGRRVARRRRGGRHRRLRRRAGRPRPRRPTTSTRSRSCATQLRADAPDGVTVQVTGPAGIQADLGQVFDGADIRLLLATAGVVALLLIITYRSPVLWLVPLTVVGVADRLAAVVATNVARSSPASPGTSRPSASVSVLVFGAGTDYALLLISRYRDELKTHDSRHEAMARAVAAPPRPSLSSATTVVLGLLTLLLSVDPDHPRPRPRVRGRRRGRGDLRAGRAARGAGALRPLGLLAARPARRRHRRWSTPTRSGTGSATPSPAGPRTFVVGTVAAARRAGERDVCRINTGLDQADQFLAEARGDLGRRAARRVLPGRHQRPASRSSPATSPSRCWRPSRRSTASTRRAITTSGDGIAQIDAVLDAAPGQRRGAGGRGRRARGRRPTSTTPTSAAATPRRSTQATTPPSDRLLILPLILAARAGRAAPAAALGRGAAAAGGDRAWRRTPPAWARRGGSSRACFGFEAMDTGRAAAGVPLPRRARRRLQHLPRHPGPRGGARARHPRRACCAR